MIDLLICVGPREVKLVVNFALFSTSQLSKMIICSADHRMVISRVIFFGGLLCS